MAADHSAPSLNHLRQAASENALQNIEIAFLGETHESERRERLPSHGINVAERICGGNLAECVRVVNDGREKIDRLYERRLRRHQIHAGVVGVIKADQNIRVMLPG
jgi:hypothetical protein